MSGLATAMSMGATLQEAVAGDQAAFARIVNAYHADMVRVAYGICADGEMARDAVQAAWLIAWRKLRSVREPDHLKGWLIAVAANEARHLARRHHSPVIDISPSVRADDNADPSEGIERLDLQRALRRLSVEDRALIALRYGAQLESPEIAPLLHLSPSGVRARLMRTMDHLRKELGNG